MLGDARLEELALRAQELRLEPGEYLFRQGEPADTVFVLLEGDLETFVTSDGRDMMTTAHHRLRTLIGVVSALTGEPFLASTRALAPSRVAAIAAADFRRATRQETRFEQSILQLFGPVYQRMEAELRGREKLAALGRLAAGLAHELNNPAVGGAAHGRPSSARACATSRRARHASASSARRRRSWPRSPRSRWRRARRERPPAAVSALDASDREEELAAWLGAHGVADPWELASTLVGRRPRRGLARARRRRDDRRAARGARSAWIGAGLAASTLVGELGEATGAHLGARDRGQGVQLHGSRARAGDRRARRDREHPDDARPQAEGGQRRPSQRDYDPDAPRITALASELNQVWTNLLDNAIAAVAGNGTITVRTRRRDDGVVVEVEDDGPGIPEEIQSRVFEPFFTTKDVGEGTGLGLEIAYRIVVDHHRGEIRVESRPGETRFVVRLPVNGARKSE